MHPALREALDRASIDSLSELARRARCRPQTLHAITCGVRRLSPAMGDRLAAVLGLSRAAVAALFRGQS